MITIGLSASYRIDGVQQSTGQGKLGIVLLSYVFLIVILSVVAYFTVSFSNVNDYQLQLVSRIFEKMKDKDASNNKF